jgi:hypothetical protein
MKVMAHSANEDQSSSRSDPEDGNVRRGMRTVCMVPPVPENEMQATILSREIPGLFIDLSYRL